MLRFTTEALVKVDWSSAGPIIVRAGFRLVGTGRCRKIYGQCRNENALQYTYGLWWKFTATAGK